MLASSTLVFTTNTVFTAHHGNCALAEKTAANKIDAAPPPLHVVELKV